MFAEKAHSISTWKSELELYVEKGVLRFIAPFCSSDTVRSANIYPYIDYDQTPQRGP